MESSPDLPRITIITPSYNQGRFIEGTIRSVLDQGYPDLEYIVMDGGSTDGTVDILKRYQDKILWVSEKDRGQSHAINKGLCMASGEVLAYLNSDDCYEPGALLRVGRFFGEHPHASWVTGRCRFIDTGGREIRRLATLYKNFWLLSRSYAALMVLDYVSQPATFWRREVIEKVGNFDEDLYYTMDYDYSLRVGKHFKLWVLNHLLASYRVHLSSKTFTSAASINAQFAEDLEVARRNAAPRFFTSLHALHNALIVNTYRILLPRGG